MACNWYDAKRVTARDRCRKRTIRTLLCIDTLLLILVLLLALGAQIYKAVTNEFSQVPRARTTIRAGYTRTRYRPITG